MTTHTAWLAQALIDSPLGPLRLVATAKGLAGVWFEGQAHHPGPLDLPMRPDWPILKDTQYALARYFEAPAQAHFGLPLDPQGTPFQQAVWRQLLQIAPGELGHSGARAQALGQPQAARAVGAAVGRNPISIIIPCHRVVGRDGRLTGYAGGLARKRVLLLAEQGDGKSGGLLHSALEGCTA